MSQIYSNLNMIHKRLFNEREDKKKTRTGMSLGQSGLSVACLSVWSS